jgi:hypothetical protein
MRATGNDISIIARSMPSWNTANALNILGLYHSPPAQPVQLKNRAMPFTFNILILILFYFEQIVP